jgi:hypothetical protein
MEFLVLPLDEVDGLNPTRALILQAYYGVRRVYAPDLIGTRQIAAWIQHHEPSEVLPSDSLILLTLRDAKLVHRRCGRPRHDRPTPIDSPLFCPRPPLSSNRATP